MGHEKGEKFKSYLNSVTIIGFIGADPEQRQARNNNGSSLPFFPLRRSGRGRTPTTSGRRRPNSIASACFGRTLPSTSRRRSLPAPLLRLQRSTHPTRLRSSPVSSLCAILRRSTKQELRTSHSSTKWMPSKITVDATSKVSAKATWREQRTGSSAKEGGKRRSSNCAKGRLV